MSDVMSGDLEFVHKYTIYFTVKWEEKEGRLGLEGVEGVSTVVLMSARQLHEDTWTQFRAARLSASQTGVSSRKFGKTGSQFWWKSFYFVSEQRFSSLSQQIELSK